MPRATLTLSMILRAMALVGLRRDTKGNGNASASAQSDLGDLPDWSADRAAADHLRRALERRRAARRNGAVDRRPRSRRCADRAPLRRSDMSRLEIRVKMAFERRVGRALGQTTALIAPGVEIHIVVMRRTALDRSMARRLACAWARSCGSSASTRGLAGECA